MQDQIQPVNKCTMLLHEVQYVVHMICAHGMGAAYIIYRPHQRVVTKDKMRRDFSIVNALRVRTTTTGWPSPDDISTDDMAVSRYY